MNLIERLEWDSDFFEMECGKCILNEKLDPFKFEKLVNEIEKYKFVSLTNINNNYEISKQIGGIAKVTLADVNIQLKKKVRVYEPQKNIFFLPSSEFIEMHGECLNMARDAFEYSKFMTDKDLCIRGGGNVYYEWLKNSIENDNAIYVFYKEDNHIRGFLLVTLLDEEAIIEITLVGNEYKNQGIATKLLRELQTYLLEKGIYNLCVGTQANNMPALNMYHKNGFSMCQINSTFHFWKMD